MNCGHDVRSTNVDLGTTRALRTAATRSRWEIRYTQVVSVVTLATRVAFILAAIRFLTFQTT